MDAALGAFFLADALGIRAKDARKRGLAREALRSALRLGEAAMVDLESQKEEDENLKEEEEERRVITCRNFEK